MRGGHHEKDISGEDKIKRRLHENNRPINFVSDRFLQELLSTLDTVGNIYKLAEELKSLLLRYDLDKIRYELARIPVRFSVVKDMQGGSGNINENIGLQRDDFRFPLNPSDYRYHPDYIPDCIPDLETHHHSDPVWCLCSEAQGQRFQAEVPFWRETDSLVDWIIECIKKEASDATQTPEIPAVASEPDVETELTRTEQIYQYIAQNSPATTRDILAQNIAERSQTYKILNDLETAGRIDKPKHGTYTVF